LHFNALSNNVPEVYRDVKSGKDVNQKDYCGDTPLSKAAEYNCIDACKAVLDLRGGVNIANDLGLTPLFYAQKYQHRVVAELLRAHGATYSIFDVVLLGNLDQVKSICETDQKQVNIENAATWTPIYMAHNINIVEHLIKSGAEVNHLAKSGFTPLHSASGWCSPCVVTLLLNHGADPNMQTDTGMTALHFASEVGNFETIRILLNYGADPICKRFDTGETPCDLARNGGYLRAVNLLKNRNNGI
jgi:ankyrin repeat protein